MEYLFNDLTLPAGRIKEMLVFQNGSAWVVIDL